MSNYQHPTTLPRSIAPNIFWLNGYLAVKMINHKIHSHSSTFLIRNKSTTMLINTNNPQN